VVIENIAMFTVFFSEENQLPKKDFRKIQSEKRKFTRVVEDIIMQGIEQGYFRRVNPKLQANAIIGMCNWLYRWYKPGKSSLTPDEIVEQFTDLLENGLFRTGEKDDNPPSLEPIDASAQPHSKRQVLKELKVSTTKVAHLLDELEKMS
jgi:hypothetical protein